jgi:TFIIF-interacting CTD phosphatase-like protein
MSTLDPNTGEDIGFYASEEAQIGEMLDTGIPSYQEMNPNDEIRNSLEPEDVGDSEEKLSPEIASDRGPRLIIFDLDETLIHSERWTRDLAQKMDEGLFWEFEWFDMGIAFRVFFRPYYKQILTFFHELGYEIGIWSAGSRAYVKPIADRLRKYVGGKFAFVWSLSKCRKSLKEYNVRKALELVRKKYDEYERLIIVEDDPSIYERYPINTIKVKPFMLDPRDEQLMNVIEGVAEIIKKKMRLPPSEQELPSQILPSIPEVDEPPVEPEPKYRRPHPHVRRVLQFSEEDASE